MIGSSRTPTSMWFLYSRDSDCSISSRFDEIGTDALRRIVLPSTQEILRWGGYNLVSVYQPRAIYYVFITNVLWTTDRPLKDLQQYAALPWQDSNPRPVSIHVSCAAIYMPRAWSGDGRMWTARHIVTAAYSCPLLTPVSVTWPRIWFSKFI